MRGLEGKFETEFAKTDARFGRLEERFNRLEMLIKVLIGVTLFGLSAFSPATVQLIKLIFR